jgi:1-phosphofructokinase
MIVTVTLNPALDKTAEIDALRTGGLNRLRNVRLDAGGKGINVSMVAAALGGKSVATGFAGGANGEELLSRLDSGGITHDFVRIAASTRVNLKVIDADKALTELNEPGPEVSAGEMRLLEHKLLSYAGAGGGTIFVLAGSLPRGVGADTYLSLARALRGAGSPVFVDADGAAFARAMEAPPDFVKPNVFELLQYFGVDDARGDDLVLMCRALLGKGVRFVALSMGAEGALFACGEGVWRVPALRVPVRSAAGAGDSMVAALAYGFERKLPLPDCVTLAVACSSGAVMTPGTEPPELHIIEKLRRQVHITHVTCNGGAAAQQ